MPTYVYACPDPSHSRKEVIHSIDTDPVVECETCKAAMRRVPQPFRWYMDPAGVLLDHMDDKYRQWRERKSK